MTGPYRASTGGQGKRTDLADACKVLKDTRSLKRMAEEHPVAFVKYHKGFEALLQLIMEPDIEDKGFVPRPWQHRVLRMLLTPADDRHVVWVHESTGNVGKSRLCRHLLIEHGATFLEGTLADMAEAYQREPIVCFDITRAQAEFSDNVYTFSEKLKNGVIFKRKYKSRPYVFTSPQVVIFSNQAPNWEGKWSADRVKIVDLQEPVWHQETILAHVRRVEGNHSPPGSPVRG